MTKKVRRLFEQFQPKHYDLALEVSPDEMVFSGKVVINGRKTGRPSQRLTFHQKELKITGAKIIKHDKKGDQEIAVSRINTLKSYDEVRLHSESMIYPGNYTVELEFSGTITRPMNGIYPSLFKHAGKDKKIISTQFESHHAREAFPCIDEPEAKATFDLTLTTPKGQTVLANTPVKGQALLKNRSNLDGAQGGGEQRTEAVLKYGEGAAQTATQRSAKSVSRVGGSADKHAGAVRTVFETTPKMSTYLLAFAFGNLEFLEAKTKTGVTIRAYATPDNVQHTKFALECAIKCLEFYNDYFDIDYPLEKCDLLALPDFAAGAMENWGLITFREQTLLVDPKNSSLDMKQYVAMVVAHELAHQWFGNLVTMRWWTDLWLNEGFASWIEYLAVDHLFPDWQMWQQFIASEQQQALALDALENSHPIEAPINHPDEIRTIFDAISYAKGSSVIHMLQNYLGAEAFRDGLRLYLKRHAYGNTNTVDLWAALEEVSGQPVKDFMHAWITQTGFPLVSASVKAGKVELAQKRFLLNPDSASTSETWPIPLLTTANDRNLFASASQKFASSSEKLKLNLGGSGFYRTSYNPDHLASLASQVQSGQLTPEDRLGLLADAFEASKAGLARTTSALELLASYASEDSPIVWEVIAGNLGVIRRVMDDEKLSEAIKPYFRTLTASQLERLGWAKAKNEPYFDSLLRPLILGLAAWADEPSVVEKAQELFKKASQPEDIEPDLRGVVYGTAARLGGASEFDKMLAQHNASASSEARLTLTAALAGFKQPSLIKRALAKIDSDEVRLQDAAYWLAYSYANRHAKTLAWQWMTENWNWLEENLGSDMSFSRFPNYAARSFSDDKFLSEYNKFFAKHNSPALDRSIKQGLETLEWQIAWRERDHAAIKKYFS